MHSLGRSNFSLTCRMWKYVHEMCTTRYLSHSHVYRLLALIITVGIVAVFRSWSDSISPNVRLLEEMTPMKCNPSSHSPSFVTLHTKQRVTYDGGQWFHMAENFLVQHSLLKKNKALPLSQQVFYNFDQG